MSIDKSSKQHSYPVEPALYLVATPVGNLSDITARAIDVLGSVDVIAAEDTRHSRKLLSHFGIATRLIACHDHNEAQVAPGLLDMIEQGQSLALISDAGTPLVSDPGYSLVAQAHDRGIRVIPVPGASAVIIALSAAGLPTDSFLFAGFLPAKQQARINALQALQAEPHTVVVYESSHRIVASLQDMLEVFGAERRITFTRELTKAFETIRRMRIGECLAWVEQDANQQKGEIVLVLEGAERQPVSDTELRRVLTAMLDENLPVKQLATLAAKITGQHKNDCYRLALELKKEAEA